MRLLIGDFCNSCRDRKSNEILKACLLYPAVPYRHLETRGGVWYQQTPYMQPYKCQEYRCINRVTIIRYIDKEDMVDEQKVQTSEEGFFHRCQGDPDQHSILQQRDKEMLSGHTVQQHV